jgi:hypothetical protein
VLLGMWPGGSSWHTERRWCPGDHGSSCNQHLACASSGRARVPRLPASVTDETASYSRCGASLSVTVEAAVTALWQQADKLDGRQDFAWQELLLLPRRRWSQEHGLNIE